MDNLNSLVCRIIDTVPMSEEELWALKGSTQLGAMVYSIGGVKAGDIADTVEYYTYMPPVTEALWELSRVCLHVEQTRP